ncbi:hypothetical protein MNBD_NITROSPINAE03-903 [hydrothermal vent metagenome]|uniref:Polyhydroxyalkanoate synthesis regulator phasin n=1 Tax=hydrothermal vent metagenome TaxID=652676 RepID=A0A3B1C7J4_9ZZZZ
MFNTLRDAAKIGMGAVWLSRENIRKFTDELIEMGRVSKEEGERLCDEISESQDEYKNKLNDLVDKAVQKALDTSGLARKSEVAELRQKVAELEMKLQKQEEDHG